MIWALFFPIWKLTPPWRLLWPYQSIKQASTCLLVTLFVLFFLTLLLGHWASLPQYRYKFAYWGWFIGTIFASYYSIAAHITGHLSIKRQKDTFQQLGRICDQIGYKGRQTLPDGRIKFYRVVPPGTTLNLILDQDIVVVTERHDEILVDAPLIYLRKIYKMVQ